METVDSQSQPFINSRFLHLLQNPRKEDAFCLFHSLTQHMVFGSGLLKQLYGEFQQFRTEEDLVAGLNLSCSRDVVKNVVGDLKSKHMIVSDSQEDYDLYMKLFAAGLDLYAIQHTYFITVSDCNLRCAYCFVEDQQRGFPTGKMSWTTAKQSLEVFAKLCDRAEKISLTFYGGEPLLNSDVVYASMRYVRQLEKEGRFLQPVEMTMLTNGVLVDDRTVEALLETGTGSSVSIDGPGPLHDASRKNLAGHGSFDAALRGYRKLQDVGLKPGVSCTLNRNNIDHMDEIVAFIAEELRPEGMGFNVLLPTICSGNPLEVSCDLAAEKLIAAFKRLRQYGIYEDRIMRRVRPFEDRGFHFKDCMGVGGQIVITPEGRIGPCQAFLGIDRYFPFSVSELHGRLPEINSETLYEQPLFKEWRHRFPLNMKKCSDCVAVALCGGGCPYASEVNAGSIWEVDERICPQAKQSLEWMIWETYDRLQEASFKGGANWQEAVASPLSLLDEVQETRVSRV